MKRIRTWVSLAPPKRRGALAKLKDVPQKTARALHGGPYGAELEVEVAAWVCFNASRTARLGRLERDLGHERSRPLTICWYEVAKGGSVVVAPAARSLLRPPLYEDGRVAVVEEVRHRAVGAAGGRKRRAQRPQAMYPQGALLRSTPIVRFAGITGSARLRCFVRGRRAARGFGRALFAARGPLGRRVARFLWRGRAVPARPAGCWEAAAAAT